MNIVMTIKDRPGLTHQALASLHSNTHGDWNAVLVDDGSDEATGVILTLFQSAFSSRVMVVRVAADRPESGIVGQLKNLGVQVSGAAFGYGDWLYLSDNDVYFTPGWDAALKGIAALTEEADKFCLWGGQNHPFHLPAKTCVDAFGVTLHEYLAVAGTSWLMRWDTWDKYGPLDGNAKGVCQSEDTAFCNRIRAAGYRVGAVTPHVVLDTGITQTDGSPSVGAISKTRVAGVMYR